MLNICYPVRIKHITNMLLGAPKFFLIFMFVCLQRYYTYTLRKGYPIHGGRYNIH